MADIAMGVAHPLRHEAAGAGNSTAGNRTDSSTMWKQGSQVMSERMAASIQQRDCRRAQLISDIKKAIADMVLATGQAARTKNSDYLSRKLHYDYTYLANLFSATTGCTIKQYIIEFKIDRVKEMLMSGEFNLTQISYKLNYSSIAHLSAQFKKVTGLTPSSFRILHCKHGTIPESVNDVNVFCNPVNVCEVKHVSFAT